MTELLPSDFDVMLAETERLDADRKAKSLTDYRDVVAGRVRIKPDKLLALLSVIGLTPANFRADAGAWAEHQQRSGEIPPVGAEAAAMETLALACTAFDVAEKKWWNEEKRLKEKIRQATVDQSRVRNADQLARERLAEIERSNPRLWPPAPPVEIPSAKRPTPINTVTPGPFRNTTPIISTPTPLVTQTSGSLPRVGPDGHQV